MKLDPNSKKNQMDKKYNIDSFKSFQLKLNSTTDLQGWRNKLISKLPFLGQISFIDCGCGLGDKSMALLNKLGGDCCKAWLIDFSSSATDNAKKFVGNDNRVNIINEDGFTALDSIEDKSIGLVILFGFLHELSNRKEFLSKLRSKLAYKYLVVVSDNDLYFTPKVLHQDFIECGYDGNCYSRFFNIFGLHFFRIIQKKIFKSRVLLSFMSGRADNIVGCYSSDRNLLKSYPI